VWELCGYGKIRRMADDLLSRILEEMRARKEASRAAYQESHRLERALAALGADDEGASVRNDVVRRGWRPGGGSRAAGGRIGMRCGGGAGSPRRDGG
jgi:hypothetical protein